MEGQPRGHKKKLTSLALADEFYRENDKRPYITLNIKPQDDLILPKTFLIYTGSQISLMAIDNIPTKSCENTGFLLKESQEILLRQIQYTVKYCTEIDRLKNTLGFYRKNSTK